MQQNFYQPMNKKTSTLKKKSTSTLSFVKREPDHQKRRKRADFYACVAGA